MDFCQGNPLVISGFHIKWPVMRCFNASLLLSRASCRTNSQSTGSLSALTAMWHNCNELERVQKNIKWSSRVAHLKLSRIKIALINMLPFHLLKLLQWPNRLRMTWQIPGRCVQSVIDRLTDTISYSRQACIRNNYLWGLPFRIVINTIGRGGLSRDSFNTSMPTQNGRRFATGIFRLITLHEDY